MEDEPERSPFTRPGFLIAAVAVALIVILGVTITALNSTRDDPGTPAAKPTESAPTVQPTKASAASAEPSLCGLNAKVPGGSLSTPPPAQWKYQGTTAYPTSPTYGPGKTRQDGVRYCFHHSAAGALFMAANAAAQGSDPAVSNLWARYVIGRGAHQEELLQGTTATPHKSEGTRLQIVGFRILDYTGSTARIDIAIHGSALGKILTLSNVYELVWQDGDWKFNTDVMPPVDTATVPDLAGYTAWGSDGNA